MNRINTNKGFTLIELLVTIVIIGLLAGILLPNMLNMRVRSRDAKRKSQLAEMKVALESYYEDYQVFPATGAGVGDSEASINGCGTTADPVDCVPGFVFSKDGVLYMQTLPTDFSYSQQNDGDGFLLWTGLENLSDQDAAASQKKCGVTVAEGEENYYYECSL